MTPQLPPAYQPLHLEGTEGPFIVLEGVSGIGKSTLARLLTKRLDATSVHTLPGPHGDWSSMVNARLRSLPQFAFYLSGVLHGSDCIRNARTLGPVVADRYVSSVIACHAAAHGVDIDTVMRLLEPYRSYLVQPTHTFYLTASENALRSRLAGKPDVKRDDMDLLGIQGRLAGLVANFAAVAEQDPTSVRLDTDDKTAEDLADWITDHLEQDRA
ncbi:dTMP kinase [Streptomyces sp. NPDC088747]|uniref:dTMP kinase n=1 Tax=Streptomyces sp. NPDC088747 TaxID=3365886 RepID=UPI00382E2373